MLKVAEKLQELGLSKLESRVFLFILRNPELAIRDISERMKLNKNGLYRIINSLLDRDLIYQSGSSPSKFSVLDPIHSIEQLSLGMKMQIDELKLSLKKDLVGKSKNIHTKTKFIAEKSKIYKFSDRLIENASKSVKIISIGEVLPKHTALINKKACKRGVDFRFIAHKNDIENKNALESLMKLGIKVRHYPDWGFHLVIVDSLHTLIGVHEDDGQRVSSYFENKDMAKAMEEYFDEIWSRSFEV